MTPNKTYDLIIIGASAAGVAAAIYAARRHLNFVMLAKDIGGEVATSGEIENYPGFKHTDGIELTEKFKEQLAYNQVTVEQPVTVSNVTKKGSVFLLAGSNDGQTASWLTKTVLIASGIHPRILTLPEEPKFRGRGLSYCTVCDAPLFKGKVTATIGGGDSALESVLMLAELCPRVYLINKNPVFKGEEALIDKVRSKKNITVISNATTTHLLGADRLTGIQYRDEKGKEQTLGGISGVFVHIGMIPNSDLAPKELEKNKIGEIAVNKLCATNIPGLFAAGDVTDTPYKQIAVATGQGVTAALSAVSHLNTLKD